MKPVKFAGKVAKHQASVGMDKIAGKMFGGGKKEDDKSLLDKAGEIKDGVDKLSNGELNGEGGKKKKPSSMESAKSITGLDANKDKKAMEGANKGSGTGAGDAMQKSGQAMKEGGKQLQAAADNIDQSLASADQSIKAANQGITGAAHAGTVASFGIAAPVTETAAAASNTATAASSAALTAGRMAAKAMKTLGKVMEKPVQRSKKPVKA